MAVPRVPVMNSRDPGSAANDYGTPATFVASCPVSDRRRPEPCPDFVSGGSVKLSREDGAPPPFRHRSGRSPRRAEGMPAAAGDRARRSSIALAMLAAAFWAAAASAADPAERVLSLLSQEKYSEARAALQPLLRNAPGAARLRLLNGILLSREGRAGEAVAVFERLRKDRPGMFEPHNNLAVIYAEQGRLDEARDVLLAALARRSDPVAFANLGDVYMRLAERAYSRARDVGAAAPAEPEARRPELRARTGQKAPPDSAAPSPDAPAVPATGEAPLASDDDSGRSGESGPFSSAPADAQDTGCVRAGRFRDRKALAEAAEWIRSRGAEIVDLRDEKIRVVTSYRVYLPASPSAKAAAAKLRELRGRGIRDVSIMRKGARGNRISLGVFKSKDNAKRRAAQLAKLGYSAKWAANAKSLGVYAIRARAGEPRSALLSSWKDRYPAQPIEPVDCS